ncbi:MAG: holo-ACP synthase [Pirellulales bacterium]|nr:holo-ACP synthase [Pirellulales bacterium]
MQHILGIGTDITECLRIAQMIERHGEVFLTRVYTSDEIRYCQNRKQATQHFASRWAAKEAVLKALGTGWSAGIQWRDVEIRSLRGGKPSVHLQGTVAEIAAERGIATWMLSVSHCRTHATAFVIALGE